MNNPSGKAKSKLLIERKSRGWSRKYVANEIGVADYTIGQWERGKHIPYPEHIQKLCDLFEKNAEELGLTGIPSDRIVEIHAEVKEERDSTPDTSSHEQQRENGKNEENGEDTTAAFNSSITDSTTYSQAEKRRRLFSPIIGFVLALLVASCFIVYVIRPFSPLQIKPGGGWISPVGPTVGDIIQFAAYAYPTHAGEPEIDHVNFTAFWPGVDPRVWIIACVARIPIRKDVYACNANLRLLGAQPGRIKISFDVYDRQENVNFAPNGEHTVTYLPSSST